MTGQRILISLVIIGIFLLLSFAIINGVIAPPAEVRGKAPALPISQEISPDQSIAQDLALSHPRVQALTVGRRSEVFGVREVQLPPAGEGVSCREQPCWQVEIYNFDENATVAAVVDTVSLEVVEVYYQPGVRPGINQRLVDLALEIAFQDPQVIDALGFEPQQADMAPVDSSLLGTACEEGHLCVAPTFEMGDRILWAVVDLTDETLAGIAWTDMDQNPPGNQPSIPQGCPAPGSVDREGWRIDYDVTGTDGLRVFNVEFNGQQVLPMAKLVQWHADYGATGFQDITGCGGGGGGFPILTYGETVIRDVYDADRAIAGFEIVQDFRMSEWGNFCNYRYEQHFQFFQDGSFKILSGAYGKGCGSGALYRPVVRIDIGVLGDADDSFYRWNGSRWDQLLIEDYLVPYAETGHGPHAFDPDGFNWYISDASRSAYYIKMMSEGSPVDGYRDDDPFLYITRHKPEEGDSDLGVIGTCCNDNHLQGPDNFLNGESIAGNNLVLWYVPQMVTETAPGSYYCWTVTGEPTPETYPCFSGPTFIPGVAQSLTAGFTHNAPVGVGQTVVFTDTSSGVGPLNYHWDFDDGGTSQIQNPTHVYTSPGDYQVSLMVTNTLEMDVYTDTISIGIPASAGFLHNGPIDLGETAVFTNTTIGTSPLTYMWEFGDGAFSSLENPTHSYNARGLFTVSLSATNPFGTDIFTDTLAVGVPPLADFSYQTPAFAGTPTRFTNKTQGGTQYIWDFGDGVGTSIAQDPIYTYQAAGTYIVRLEASNKFGTDIRNKQVVVSQPFYLPMVSVQGGR